jgi:protein phosphatase
MNCGDRRLYRFRNGELTQLTSDHSLSNMLGSSHHSNIITNCIRGGCSTSFMDIVKITDDVKIGDVYLLCIDGLTDMLPDHVITTLLTNGADANKLCDAAVAAGGLDNVSCCVLQF